MDSITYIYQLFTLLMINLIPFIINTRLVLAWKNKDLFFFKEAHLFNRFILFVYLFIYVFIYYSVFDGHIRLEDLYYYLLFNIPFSSTIIILLLILFFKLKKKYFDNIYLLLLLSIYSVGIGGLFLYVLLGITGVWE